MALNYYIDPSTGRRTTRDQLVHRRTLADHRVAKWARAYEDATGRYDRARTRRTREKYRHLANHAARWGARADHDVAALNAAIEEGDGRRPYRYRWSVSYQSGKRKRLQVDILLHKDEYERASNAEVKHAIGELMRLQGVPPDGWHAEYVTWYHGPERYVVKDRLVDVSLDAGQQRAAGAGLATAGLAAFRTVIQQGRIDAVVGEEELERALVVPRQTKSKGRGRPPKRKGT